MGNEKPARSTQLNERASVSMCCADAGIIAVGITQMEKLRGARKKSARNMKKMGNEESMQKAHNWLINLTAPVCVTTKL